MKWFTPFKGAKQKEGLAYSEKMTKQLCRQGEFFILAPVIADFKQV
jgi:hypothetical protein